MGKQPTFLEDVTHPAPVSRRADTALRVQQHRSIDGDTPAFGVDQPGNHIDD